MFFPLYAYSAGGIELSIENKTGAHITQILITELKQTGEVKKELKPINRSIENDGFTVIRLKKDTLYGIILVDTNERQYAKKRQAWNEEAAIISFRRNDILDRNIWDKTTRVLLWPMYL